MNVLPDSTYNDVIYLSALRKLDKVGLALTHRLRKRFPQATDFLAASDAQLTDCLQSSPLAIKVLAQRDAAWDSLWQEARDALEWHLAQDIRPLAFTDQRYPALLHLVEEDAPLILYVKGSLEAVQRTRAVAIVGTREPTPLGPVVARRVARHFASRDFCIVSGLAKGIDTAGHQGALEAQGGRTVAVFGTPLDIVYPAQNKRLAEAICANGGALVSEYALGTARFRNAFAARDRIQAGMSLAVIVVQTTADGGSMIAVRAARKYERPVLCPKPLIDQEGNVPQYMGITQVISEGGRAFTANDYPDIEALLEDVHQRLLSSSAAQRMAAPMPAPNSNPGSNSEQSTSASTLWSMLDS